MLALFAEAIHNYSYITHRFVLSVNVAIDIDQLMTVMLKTRNNQKRWYFLWCDACIFALFCFVKCRCIAILKLMHVNLPFWISFLLKLMLKKTIQVNCITSLLSAFHSIKWLGVGNTGSNGIDYKFYMASSTVSILWQFSVLSNNEYK